MRYIQKERERELCIKRQKEEERERAIARAPGRLSEKERDIVRGRESVNNRKRKWKRQLDNKKVRTTDNRLYRQNALCDYD